LGAAQWQWAARFVNDYQADAFLKEPLLQHKEGLPLGAPLETFCGSSNRA
jgi:hypothetical protein